MDGQITDEVRVKKMLLVESRLYRGLLRKFSNFLYCEDFYNEILGMGEIK